MCIRKSRIVLAGAAVMAIVVAASAHAWADHTNYLTFNAPIALPGVTLPAGTYTFRTPTDTDPNIVQVMNRAGNKSYYMGITHPAVRPRAGTEMLVMVGEAPKGQARPIQAWFPLGERDGHAFIFER
jgi:hypothetical protein